MSPEQGDQKRRPDQADHVRGHDIAWPMGSQHDARAPADNQQLRKPISVHEAKMIAIDFQ
jgi:hypothetical protein